MQLYEDKLPLAPVRLRWTVNSAVCDSVPGPAVIKDDGHIWNR